MATALSDFFGAVDSGDKTKVLQMINKKEVDINARDPANKNRTALHVAILQGHNDLVKTLVDECKADINIEDQNKDIPLNIAFDCYNVNLVKFLVSRNSARSEDVKDMLNDPATDEFFEAVAANNIAKVKQLLDSKAVDVDARNAGDYKRTGLHVAATKGYEELVNILVNNYKANINLDDEIGELPLHNAADNGHPKIVKFLAGKGSRKVDDVKEMLEEMEAAS